MLLGSRLLLVVTNRWLPRVLLVSNRRHVAFVDEFSLRKQSFGSILFRVELFSELLESVASTLKPKLSRSVIRFVAQSTRWPRGKT